jgi:hypothetical protein
MASSPPRKCTSPWRISFPSDPRSVCLSVSLPVCLCVFGRYLCLGVSLPVYLPVCQSVPRLDVQSHLTTYSCTTTRFARRHSAGCLLWLPSCAPALSSPLILLLCTYLGVHHDHHDHHHSLSYLLLNHALRLASNGFMEKQPLNRDICIQYFLKT